MLALLLHMPFSALAFSRRAADRLRREHGQTSAEYALVLLGAAAVALLIALWAKNTDKLGDLLDAVVDSVISTAT